MLNVKKLQAIRDKILGVTTNPNAYGDLNSVVYLQQILDGILGTNLLRVRGNLAEHVYLQQILNAKRGVADGQFGSLPNSVYLQQIVNATNGVSDVAFGSMSESSYLDAWLANEVTGGVSTLSYATVLRNTYGASEVWPLVDIVSGTTIKAKVLAARNGLLTGWDLRNAAGPVPGTLAVQAGVGDFGSVYSANGSTGFADIFSGVTGWATIWLKAAAGLWTDGALHYGLYYQADGNNFVRLRKTATNNQFDIAYRAAGTISQVLFTMSDTDWFQIGITWDRTAGANGQVLCYKNGVQQGVTQVALGNWAGVIPNFGAAIGSGNGLASATPWLGWIAYPTVRFGATLTPAQMLAQYQAAATSKGD